MSSLPNDSDTTPVQEQRALGKDAFPPELALQILKHLPNRDLRAFSETSKNSYELALEAGLHILCTVRWRSTQRGFGESLWALGQLVTRAQDVNPALNIAIHASFAHSAPRRGPVPATDIQRLISTINRALPYVVSLNVVFPPATTAALYSSFGADAAPKLRDLELDLSSAGVACIPSNLFSGDAPKLRRVSLILADTEPLCAPGQVAVFKRVTHLKVALRNILQHLPLAQMFPALRALAIEAPFTPQAGKIDISGLRLDYLALAGEPGLVTGAAVDAIAVVEHRANGMPAAFWPAKCDTLFARAECSEFGTAPAISFVPPDGAWRRTLEWTTGHGGPLPLSLADATRLVSLTLDKTLVNAFAQAPLELRSLRALYIDLSTSLGAWPPVDPEQLGLRVHFDDVAPAVRCPALERIIIFAHKSKNPVTVRPNKVPRLARALGIGEAKPVLTLAGCTFYGTPMWPVLHQKFSAVEVVECTGDRIPEYYDTCRYSGSFNGTRSLI